MRGREGHALFLGRNSAPLPSARTVLFLLFLKPAVWNLRLVINRLYSFGLFKSTYEYLKIWQKISTMLCEAANFYTRGWGATKKLSTVLRVLSSQELY